MVKQRKVIALGGPNLRTYIGKFPKNVKYISIWEKNRATMLLQLPQLRKSGLNIQYNFGDIINAPVDKDAFYDLDFCGSILSVNEYIEKFKECPFSITLSIRPVGKLKTINLFLEATGEQLVSDTVNPLYHILTTSGNSYLYTMYTDSSPMIQIFKL